MFLFISLLVGAVGIALWGVALLILVAHPDPKRIGKVLAWLALVGIFFLLTGTLGIMIV